MEEILVKLSISSKELLDPLITNISKERKDPFRILIATILSLRTKDEITRKTSKNLFSRADTPDKIFDLPIEELEQLIYPVGFYKRKAITIQNICKRLIEEYDSRVPDSLEKLLNFKGVGRKTANLVITMGYNIPGICVDVHVARITQRIGIVPIKGEIEGKTIYTKPDDVEDIAKEVVDSY